MLAPRLLPPRLRLRLTALLAMLRREGDDRDDRAAEVTAARVGRWQKAMLPHLERPLRPTVVCLPGLAEDVQVLLPAPPPAEANVGALTAGDAGRAVTMR